jgi:fibronectin type 3 domain-containing protein
VRAFVAVGLILAGHINILNSLNATQVTLAWDASPDPAVVSYNVYYGGSSQNYTNIISSGSATFVTASNLVTGGKYYFAATAVDNAGLESAFSDEVMYQSGQGQCTVSISNLTQVYDGTAKTVSIATSPAGVAVAVTYNGATSAPISAGSYQVVASVIDTNYVGGVTNTLTISKATAVVQFSGLNQIYDGTVKSPAATTVPAGLALSLTYNGARTAPTSAGTYQVIATINDPNYLGASTNTLTVSKATGIVQMAGLNQAYDGNAKYVSITTTPTNLAVSLAYNGSVSVPTNSGTYQVIATINDLNYSGGSTNQLVVAKGIASVQLSGLNQIYDGIAKAASATTIPVGLSLSLTYNGTSGPPTNAGSYQVIATVTDQNYAGGSTNILTISKAAGLVQMAGLNQVYDGSPKRVSVTTTPTGLTVGLAYNGSASAPANSGAYQVIATINDPNYAGASTNSLTISKAIANITFTGLNQVFDGKAKCAQATAIPNGLAISLVYPGITSLPTNAGSYLVVATVNDANYTASGSNTLVIAKARGTVSLSNLIQTYDGMPKPVTAATVPQGLSVLLAYDSQSTAPSKPGSYTVVGTINDMNYVGSALNTLTITKAKGYNIGAAPSAPANSAQLHALILPAPAAPALTLSWAPTSRPIEILQSYDLVTWTTLTNIPGQNGSVSVPVQTESRFFIGRSASVDGTARVPLFIQLR